MPHSESQPAPGAGPRTWLLLLLPVLLAGGLTVGAARVSTALHPPPRSGDFVALSLDELDSFVEKRFQTVDMMHFGIERMSIDRPGHRAFTPTTAEEKAVTREIRDSGWVARILTVGRGVLTPEEEGFTPTKSQPVRYDELRHEVSYSVDLVQSPLAKPRSLGQLAPATQARAMQEFNTGSNATRLDDKQLRAAGRQVLTKAPLPAAYDYRDGIWHVQARPVPATQASCVSCHNPGNRTNLELGDTVGVVIYALARKSEFGRSWRGQSAAIGATVAQAP